MKEWYLERLDDANGVHFTHSLPDGKWDSLKKGVMLSACPREAGEAKHLFQRVQALRCAQGDIFRGFKSIIFTSFSVLRMPGKNSKKPPEYLYEGYLPNKLDALEKRIVSCRRCPRLVEWRERMGREKRRAYRGETYWAKPVPGFGDPRARVLAVGLAPGAHGSNRTGRMFTGDASGDFLYPALHRAGFADRPAAIARGDGLALEGLFLSAVCRCAPPDNKPTAEEIANCLPYLAGEIRLLPDLRVLAALGKIAYDALVRLLKAGELGIQPAVLPESIPPFGHGVHWPFVTAEGGRIWMAASYHPSRQNTQTGRLTRAMFDRFWRLVTELASSSTKEHEGRSEEHEE